MRSGTGHGRAEAGDGPAIGIGGTVDDLQRAGAHPRGEAALRQGEQRGAGLLEPGGHELRVGRAAVRRVERGAAAQRGELRMNAREVAAAAGRHARHGTETADSRAAHPDALVGAGRAARGRLKGAFDAARTAGRVMHGSVSVGHFGCCAERGGARLGVATEPWSFAVCRARGEAGTAMENAGVRPLSRGRTPARSDKDREGIGSRLERGSLVDKTPAHGVAGGQQRTVVAPGTSGRKIAAMPNGRVHRRVGAQSVPPLFWNRWRLGFSCRSGQVFVSALITEICMGLWQDFVNAFRIY
jgi:hypothetical protein